MRSDRRAERAGAESGAAPQPGEPWVWIDGRIGPASEARISTLDHAFLYGDSVFETLRTHGGRPFRLDAHLDRLERSAARIALDLPLDRSALRRIVGEVASVAAPGDAGLRLMVSRGEGPLGIDPAPCRAPGVIVHGWSIEPGLHPQCVRGVDLVLSGIRRNPPAALDPTMKSGNMLNGILALNDARARGGEDGVLLTLDGTIAEGPTWNLFWVVGAEVRTAEATSVLGGVTRGVILERLAARGAPTRCGAFPAEDLADATEAFCTSSLRGIVPVRSIEGRRLPVPGPVTRDLAAEYASLIDCEGA